MKNVERESLHKDPRRFFRRFRRKSRPEEQKKLPFFGIPLLLPYLKPYRRVIACLIGFGVLGGVVDVLLPLFQQYAIDHFVAEMTTAGLGAFIALYLGALSVSVAANSVSAYASCQMEMYTARDMRRACFNHLQTLSASYYNTHAVGYIHSRLISDTGRISSVVSWMVLDVIFCGVYIVGALISMFVIRPLMALCVAVLLPFAILFGLLFKKKLTVLFHDVRESNAMVTGRLNEGITGAPTAKSLAIEEKMSGIFRKASGTLFRQSMKMARLRGLFGTVFSLTTSVALALVLYAGGVLSLQGVFLVGTLALFVSYVVEMVDRLNGLVNTISQLINSEVNIQRFTDLMNTHTEVTDAPEVIEKYGDAFSPKKENWEPMLGDILFDDVTFRYPDGEENVLEHFTLHIPRGTNCAIVGETGAGKSTLVNLVCRFFEPTQGRVLMDGKDLRARSGAWLHANVGYVLQTPHLFSGSVRENLLYGNPDASEEEMQRAVRQVAAEDIVERIGGYDADVGEGGDRLSTGEKQLLSFARALIADPALFILDEATSSIDTVTEQKLQEAIRVSMEGRTSLVIAHRLSTIRRADMILVVKDGKIIERGTHESLIAEKGYYYDLYRRQFSSEAEKKSFE